MSEISSSAQFLDSKEISDLTINSDSEIRSGDTAAEIGKCDKNSDMPKDFEDDNITKLSKYDSVDDWIDEDRLKHLESHLTDTERETHYKEALELKEIGNDEFKNEKYLQSINTYTKALKLCPLKYKNDRSILYANRAASKVRLGRKESAIDDCTKAVELNDKYLKAYFRRAKLYEETEKLEESCQDYKKILTFDPGNKDALQAQYRLPPKIAERNEKLKTEMLGKLKDLGNVVLKPFGLSTDNFQLKQDPTTAGYSVNFVQNTRK